MTTTPTAPLDLLDIDELFMLGLRASQHGDSGSAMAYFKLALSRNPDHVRSHWALAAEYATLKMPDRAGAHFAEALRLAPNEPVLRFQAGLLLLTSGRVSEADAVWAPLDEMLQPDNPVRLFKLGLQQMVQDQFDVALQTLHTALASPELDAALGKDIEMTIARIEEAKAAGSAPAASAPEGTEAVTADSVESHLAFSAYRTGNDSTH